MTEPAVVGKEIREGQARHRRRQSERKINQRVDGPFAGKLVADQHPREDGSEQGVRERGDQRGAERQSVCGQRAVGRGQPPEVCQGNLQRFQKQTGDRNEGNRAQIKDGETHRQAESRQGVELFFCHEWS